MEKYFSVGKAAQESGLTAETLRHYDRIGLVRPCKTDKWTGYRYYSEAEIVQLSTVRALQCLGLSLQEVGEILAMEGLDKLVCTLEETMKKADKKIAALNEAKARIGRARDFYAAKSKTVPLTSGAFLRTCRERVILLSDTMTQPTLDNLWNYHRHFFAQLGAEKSPLFAFEDLAGVYEKEERTQMFALCSKHVPVPGLKILPAGDYLCEVCSREEAPDAILRLKKQSEQKSGVPAAFCVKLVVLTGILQWKYEIQVPL